VLTPKQPASVADLLALAPDDAAGLDLARTNLLCAVGLRGSESLQVEAALALLDTWVLRIRSETDRYLFQFIEKPQDYQNSEAYYRVLMMVTVLQQDLGVHYNMARVNDPDFTNAQDVLIGGMLGSANGGTCSSMPVLYTAVARRLGYPVKLVKGKEHLLCRWDGPWRGKQERFNIEGAGRGMNNFPDEHYRKWPHPISQAEVDRGAYLRSLLPAEDLAVCLASRAYVLEANGDIVGAGKLYARAAELDPRDDMLPRLASQAIRHTIPKRVRPAFAPPADGDPMALNAWNQAQQARLMPPGPQPGQPAPAGGVGGLPGQ